MQLFAKKRSISYLRGIGYIYRIPRIDSEGRHASEEIREEWVKEKAERNEHFPVYSICGELSSVEFVNFISINPKYKELCDSYEIIFGPRIESVTIRNKLKKLMEENPRIKVYSYYKRPDDHGIKFGDKIFSEEDHKEGTKYTTATLVEKAEKGLQDKFMAKFYQLRANSKEIPLSEIDTVQTMS
jgi:hypothetical protein